MAALLCVGGMLLLGACGTAVAGRGDESGQSPTATAPIPWTTMQPSAVTGVRLGRDGRTLLLNSQVPKGPHACMRKLKAVLTDPMTDVVRVQVTFTSPSLDRASGCTKESTATAEVRLPEPLGNRQLVVDNYTIFTADGAKPPALRLCGELGCNPAPTGCTTASYDQALMTVEAPKHTIRGEEKCDGKWLVMDYSWRAGPACDDPTNPACSARLGNRAFFRSKKSGWEPITVTATGGCRDVQRQEPAFPTALCESLAPLPPSLHPHYAPKPNSRQPGAHSTTTATP